MQGLNDNFEEIEEKREGAGNCLPSGPKENGLQQQENSNNNKNYKQDDLGVVHFEPGTIPDQGEEIIKGVLHKGCVGIFSAPPKAGKTCSMGELSIAAGSGEKWFNWECAKTKVLVVDGEMRLETLEKRYKEIADRKVPDQPEVLSNISFKSLRGQAKDLKDLAGGIIEAAISNECSLIIIDPAYPFMIGDENSAGDVREFTNEVMRIAEETGSAVMFTHHHPKYSNINKPTIDRMSGSNVLARMPDAIIDMIEIKPSGKQSEQSAKDGPAFQVSTELREFPNEEPFNCWFQYPIHVVDTVHALDNCKVSTPERNGGKKRGKQAHDEKIQRIKGTDEIAGQLIKEGNGQYTTLSELAEKVTVRKETLRGYIKESNKYCRVSTSNVCYIVPIDQKETFTPPTN